MHCIWHLCKTYCYRVNTIRPIRSKHSKPLCYKGENSQILNYKPETKYSSSNLYQTSSHISTFHLLMSDSGLGQWVEYYSMMDHGCRAFLSVARIITGRSRQHWSHTVQIVALSDEVSLHQHQTCSSGKTAVSKWCLHSGALMSELSDIPSAAGILSSPSARGSDLLLNDPLLTGRQ